MSLFLPLARGSVDPMVASREGFDARRALEEGAGVFAATDRGAILTCADGPDSSALRLMRLDSRLALELIDEGVGVYFLGRSSAGEVGIGLGLSAVGTHERVGELASLMSGEPAYWRHLRSAGHCLLGDDPAFALPLVSLAAWHARAGFCARCGQPVRSIQAGWASECSGCHHIEYPRQDPAIIVRVEDREGRVLLAHNAAWPEARHSLIAGFVEGGETPENAVIREVEEEVGLEVMAPEYRATQPWPFPRSQMMGFVAQLRSDAPREPEPDGVEIDQARFYSREEFAAALLSGRISAPGPASIAHALLVEWFGGPLPASPIDAGLRSSTGGLRPSTGW